MGQSESKIITKIEQQSGNKDRYSIYINGIYEIGVSSDIVVKYRLIKGQEINNIEDIIKAEEYKKAENYALRLLSYHNKSEQEIIRRMQDKGFELESINATLDFLKKHQYIDDEAYASSLVENRTKSKKLGKTRIKQELYRKGIDKDIIQKTISEISSEDELQSAFELAEKKLQTTYRNDDDRAKYQKLGGFLQRKGFDYEVISKVLSQLLK